MGKMTFEKVIMNVFKAEGKANLALINLKKNFSYNEYYNCIKMMLNNKIYSGSMAKFFSISDVNELINESTFPILIMDQKNDSNFMFKDLYFILALFGIHEEKILQYLKLKETFEDAFLEGDYQTASEHLDQIYKLCGLSFWYIESKLMLLNETDYNSYREYYLKIRNSCTDFPMRSYIRLLKRKINMRTRQSDFKIFYKENFGRILKDDSNAAIFTDYAEFMSFEENSCLSEEKTENLVLMLHHLSIIDSFNLFKKLIMILYVQNSSNKNINEIYEKYNCLFHADDNVRGTAYHETKQLFVLEKYIDCKQKCEALLKVHSSWFEILDIYLKLHIILEEDCKFEKTPLQKLIYILFLCYTKNDSSYYGSSFVDYCDRYLRAFSNFSAYYELLGIISDRMYVSSNQTRLFYELKIRSRNYPHSEGLLFAENFEIYTKKLLEFTDTFYTCDWSIHFRENISDKNILFPDKITEFLLSIDNNEIIYWEWRPDSSNLQKIYYEEHAVKLFQRYLDLQDYKNAIYIYVSVYFKSQYMLLRMDYKSLNNNLPEFACESLLDDLDFFIYANLTHLNAKFNDIPSQTIVDSFACILRKHKTTLPSEVVTEDGTVDEKILTFWEFCCGNILSESPCDLYDEEEYIEQITLLNKLIDYTQKTSYKEWLSRVEQEYDYFKISHIINKKDWITDKIIADWINLKNDPNIISSYNEFKNATFQDLLNDNKLMGVYKEVFVICKKEYVRQINNQMGTTIRHGILEAEFVQLLKKYHLFIPECDQKEKKKIFTSNQFILSVPDSQRGIIWNILQENCLKLFEEIDRIKREYIFFTHKEKYMNFTSLYLTDDEMKQQVALMDDISSEIKFLNEIKKMLNRVLTGKLPVLKRNVIDNLKKAMLQYVNNLEKQLECEKISFPDLSSLQHSIDETITKIGLWFNLIHNGDQLYDLKAYLLYQEKIYTEIAFIYDQESTLIKLNIIRCIEVILKNLIRNIELHSGYIANLKEAEAQIKIIVKTENNHIEIEATNRLSTTVDISQIINAIKKINTLFLSQENTEIDERHGLGYKRIATFIQNNFEQPYLHAGLSENMFKVSIAFNYGGES